MIKFFRKIRYDLMEKNKFSKYLIYAIGEILLVVIGILIALQIGDWNENRKKEAWKATQIKALKSELIDDVQALKSDLKYLEGELAISMSQSERLSAEDATIDTLVKIVRYEFNPVINGIIEPNKTTFTSLKSSAKIDLLGNELSSKIQKYYTIRDRDFRITYDNGKSYNSVIEFLVLNYPINRSAIAGPLQNVLWQDTDLQKLVATFNGVLTVKTFLLNNRKSKMQNALEQTQGVIDYLDSVNNMQIRK